MLNNIELDKISVAKEALKYIKPNIILGIGSGSTVDFFIKEIANLDIEIKGVVAASNASENLLKSYGIRVLDLNEVDRIDLYVDGADQYDEFGNLVKGGGGALTKEKILASASQEFICIAQDSKKVRLLGSSFPIAMEVLPMARSLVSRKLVGLGFRPIYRVNYVTDNANHIVDAYHDNLTNPYEMEKLLNQIPGLIENGIFSINRPKIILSAGDNNINKIIFS